MSDYSMHSLLLKMAEIGGSDLFITADAVPKSLVHGKLVSLGDLPLTATDTSELAREVCTQEQWDEFRKIMDLNLAYKVDSQRWRLNIYYQRGCVAIVARVISTIIPTLSELKMPNVMQQMVMAKRGIIFVTGGTGSGKSTTLAAMIDHRNINSSGHIVTVEDPVEFVHEHKGCIISQREVGTDTLTFDEALRSALRQAPNVILVGEIRDMETANFAMHASDTGHLVLGTLHTINANQTIERLVNMFPPEQSHALLYQLGNNLVGIISQRLVPTVDGKRCAAIEILVNTSRIQELVQSNKLEEIKATMSKGSGVGMQTFDQALYNLCQAGLISEDTAIKYADSSNDVKLRLRGIGV